MRAQWFGADDTLVAPALHHLHPPIAAARLFPPLRLAQQGLNSISGTKTSDSAKIANHRCKAKTAGEPVIGPTASSAAVRPSARRPASASRTARLLTDLARSASTPPTSRWLCQPDLAGSRQRGTRAQAEADARGEIDWRVSVDSTIARVHQHGATAARSQLTPTTSHPGGSVTDRMYSLAVHRGVRP
jgi:hypothetical protein